MLSATSGALCFGGIAAKRPDAVADENRRRDLPQRTGYGRVMMEANHTKKLSGLPLGLRTRL